MNYRRSKAFTVIELLIVITIIVLVLGLAVPAFNILTGSRSESSAMNQISAFLGRARSEAIGVQETRGVFFFPDTVSGRAVGMIVHFAGVQGAPTYVSSSEYTVGQYVYYGTPPRPYACVKDNGPTSPNGAQTPSTISPPFDASNVYWVPMSTPTRLALGALIDSVGDEDTITLPNGIAIQVLSDGKIGDPNNPNVSKNANGRQTDGYLRCGAILFDSSGRITSQQIAVAAGGLLGKRLGLLKAGDDYPAKLSPCLTNGYPYESSFGFVLYDRDALAAQPFYSDNDYNVRFPGLTPVNPSAQEFQVNGSEIFNTTSEETWLDRNSTPVLINRYNGSLIKGPS